MTPFRPKHPRLVDLQLAGIMGHMLDARFEDVPEDAWLRQMADEILPWEIGDDELDLYLLRSDRHERTSNFRPEGERPTIH